MGNKQRVQTRMDPDRAERVEQYAEEKGITHAEAVRRLVERGLDAEAGRLEVSDGGQVVDDLDTIKADLEARERADAIQSVGFLLAVPFLALGFLGLLDTVQTVAFGVPLIAIILYSTYRRWDR